jgi:hypothetical protein
MSKQNFCKPFWINKRSFPENPLENPERSGQKLSVFHRPACPDLLFRMVKTGNCYLLPFASYSSCRITSFFLVTTVIILRGIMALFISQATSLFQTNAERRELPLKIIKSC